MNATVDTLLNEIKAYNEEEVEKVTKAYKLAEHYHDGQYRQSGEPYIIHPINVAYILTEMHADADTICAGLLHDVLEDTKATYEEIDDIFHGDVAKLVDGVTKISKLSSKETNDLASTRKIITGITDDVRIIIIKLADRLHNMRTLQYKSEFKQKENALETMEIFAPLARYIGAYKIKNELEDLSFKYINISEFKRLKEIKHKIEIDSVDCIQEMLSNIHEILESNDIPNDIKIQTKNIYGIYKNLLDGKKIRDMHDLIALIIMTNEIRDCYYSLGLIHNEYHPINETFKDYICNPKTNMYKSLHTTVFAPDERLVQALIRTYDMDRVDTYGLTALWDIEKGNARNIMQEDLKNKFQFYKSLQEIDKVFGDNREFVETVKKEILSDKIYVFTTKGEIIELPKGSTPIDFAYKIHTDLGNTLDKVYINDEEMPLNMPLSNMDRVKIETNKDRVPDPRWIDYVKTTKAKRKIKEFTKN